MNFKTVVIVFALNCAALAGADFFPLQDGNTWTYREATTGATLNVQVGPPVTNAGKVYYKLSGYVTSDLLVRIDGRYGELMYWDDAQKQEFLLTSFEPFEGGHWLARQRPCPEQDGQTQVMRGQHDGPAGPVSDVLEITYRPVGCADVGPLEEQYAEHLGMLRRTDTSIAGPRVFDLVFARVGNITIEASPSVKFSVSANPTNGPGPVSATFRLQVNSSPLTLSFASGQEFDFVLKDNLGAELWKWSATATFIQSTHQRTVTDEWSETVQIPWPTTPDGKLLQPGDYTVEATVTTAGSSPFAATLPVTIASKEEAAAQNRRSGIRPVLER
jgi:Intracellular proteinase inhibitor